MKKSCVCVCCWCFCPASRSTFSYLKRTKMQDFDQTFSGCATPGPPQWEGTPIPHPRRPHPCLILTPNNIFDAPPPLVINDVKRQKFHVRSSIMLQLLRTSSPQTHYVHPNPTKPRLHHWQVAGKKRRTDRSDGCLEEIRRTVLQPAGIARWQLISADGSRR